MKKIFAIAIPVILLLSSLAVHAPDQGTKKVSTDDVRGIGDIKAESRSRANDGQNITHLEQDSFGGSWFDDFEDESGVEWKEKIFIDNGVVTKWPLNAWSYRKSIEISEHSGYNLTDYPILVTINQNNFDYSNAQNNGGDIRFSDENGIILSYWIEEWMKGGVSKIWVRVPKILKSEISRIWMYYGNNEAISNSNLYKVAPGGFHDGRCYELYDDFQAQNLDNTKWISRGSVSLQNGKIILSGDPGQIESLQQFGIGYLIEAYGKRNNDRIRVGFGQWGNQLINEISSVYRHPIDSGHLYAGDGNSIERVPIVPFDNNWHIYKVARYPDKTIGWYDANSGSSNKVFLNKKPAWVNVWNGNQIEFDWIRVCKYTTVEPTNSFGNEQNNPELRISPHIVSTLIILPEQMQWDTCSLTKTEQTNTYINVSFLNASTNQTINGYENLTGRTIDISNITANSIRLKAWFSGELTATPSLDSWGVEWTAEKAWRDSFVGDGGSIISDNSIVGYWKFDEGRGNIIKDYSGNENNGILFNSEVSDWVEGKYRGAIELDGKDEYVNCGDNSSLEITGAITLEVWVKFNVLSGVHSIIDKRPNRGYSGYFLQQDNNDIRFIHGTSSHEIITSSNLFVNTNEWYQIVVTDNLSEINVFVNGILKETKKVSGVPVNSGKLYIGSTMDLDYAHFFDGTIDEIRISNVARTSEEIRRGYQTGIAIRGGQVELAISVFNPIDDPSCEGYWGFDEGSGIIAYDGIGNGNNGTLMNGPNWVNGRFGKALQFDGDDDFVEIESFNNINNNAGTVMLWVKDDWKDGGNEGILNFGDKGSNDLNDIAFYKEGLGLHIWAGGAPLAQTWINIPAQWNNGEWHHLSFSWEVNKNFIVYLDGHSIKTIACNSAPNILWGRIGYRLKGTSHYFEGTIDDVSFFNTVLTPEKILSLKNRYEYSRKSSLKSEKIPLPFNQTWNTLHFNRSVPNGTYLNISVHDTTTNETLASNISHNSTSEYIDLSSINAIDHNSIYLQAHFETNGTRTPVLYDWAVNWSPPEKPKLIGVIEDIIVYEDTPKAGILNLSNHFEDKYSDACSPEFTLDYDDTNITLEMNGSFIDITELADNFTGSIPVQVICTNVYNKNTTSNSFKIIITGVNDPPIWTGLPDTIFLPEDTTIITEWTLADFVVDGDDDDIGFTVLSSNFNITASVENDKRLKVTASGDYYGESFLIVCAFETHNHSARSNNISIPLTVTAVNDPPLVKLFLPANGSVLWGATVTFEWKSYDIDNPSDDLAYQLNLGTMEEPSVHTSDITGNKFTVSGLEDGKIYYWSIIPNDKGGKGICQNGTWSFSIQTNVTIVETVLNSPLNNSIMNTTGVNLTWNIRNLTDGMPIYLVYLGTERNNLSEIAKTLDQWHQLNDLDDNNTYYWKVVPVIGAMVGRCSQGIWSFSVNTRFEAIYNITAEIDVERIDIVHGEGAVFNLTISNGGNIPTLVELKAKGIISGLLDMPDTIGLQISESRKVIIGINRTTSLFPDTYELTVDIIHPGGLKIFSIPVNITSKEAEQIDDDEQSPNEKSSGFTTVYLIIVLALLFLILAVGIIIIMKRRRSKEEEDELEKVEADIVKPGDSPFSRPQQAPPSQLMQPPSQFAPSVKHSSYKQKTSRAVPSAFSTPPQASKEEPRTIESILSDVRPEIAPSPQSPSVPAPPTQVEQLPLRAGEPGISPASSAPQPIPSGPQIVGIDTQFSISDIFLIYVDGRLVKSVSFGTKLSEGMDEDIMSGMLTAITDFIKDSFSEETGSLKSLQYGKMTIYLERGVGMYLAVVFHGHPPHNLREKMRWLLIHLWERYKLKLKVWDGSMDGLDGLDIILKGLMGQTEPSRESSMASSSTTPPITGALGPKISTATEAVMCGICMGVVKPGLQIMTCSCSGKYHRSCGQRIGVCPKCNASFAVPVEIPKSTHTPQIASVRDEVPVPVGFRRKARDPMNVSFNGVKREPAGYMPPPPEEILNDDTKYLPEYSGQRAGETGDMKIDM